MLLSQTIAERQVKVGPHDVLSDLALFKLARLNACYTHAWHAFAQKACPPPRTLFRVDTPCSKRRPHHCLAVPVKILTCNGQN